MIKSEQSKNNVLPMKVEHLGAVVKIAAQCNLSFWTVDDYRNEINQTDCIGFISIAEFYDNKRYNQLTRKVNGFILSRLIKLNHQHIYYSAECEIINIGVEPNARQKGIGQTLFDRTVEECRRNNVRSLWLEVRESNEHAVEFYRKNNFAVLYTRKNYYRNPPENALVMKAELSEQKG